MIRNRYLGERIRDKRRRYAMSDRRSERTYPYNRDRRRDRYDDDRRTYRRDEYGRDEYSDYHGSYPYEEERYSDYDERGDYSSGYEEEEKNYREDLREWIEKLKKKDRFGMTMPQVINHARNIGVTFNGYTEEEFYAVYLMNVSDYRDVGLNDPTLYIKLAKAFFDDDDISVSPCEKLCIYFYKIVKGE